MPGRANFEILKNKKNCLDKDCPKLLCGLGIGHRRRQTIPMWGERNSSGHHCMSGVCGIEYYVLTW